MWSGNTRAVIGSRSQRHDVVERGWNHAARGNRKKKGVTKEKLLLLSCPSQQKRGTLGKVEAADTVLPAAEPPDAPVVREEGEKEAFARRTFECAAQTKVPENFSPESCVCACAMLMHMYVSPAGILPVPGHAPQALATQDKMAQVSLRITQVYMYI